MNSGLWHKLVTWCVQLKLQILPCANCTQLLAVPRLADMESVTLKREDLLR